MSEFDSIYQYEEPVNARESYDFAISETDMDDWLIELAEYGL
jgi:hypothetical protein